LEEFRQFLRWNAGTFILDAQCGLPFCALQGNMDSSIFRREFDGVSQQGGQFSVWKLTRARVRARDWWE
jgi:hypothetical protein